jgi:hypothetical protein
MILLRIAPYPKWDPDWVYFLRRVAVPNRANVTNAIYSIERILESERPTLYAERRSPKLNLVRLTWLTEHHVGQLDMSAFAVFRWGVRARARTDVTPFADATTSIRWAVNWSTKPAQNRIGTRTGPPW